MSLERSSEPLMGIAIAGVNLISYQEGFSGGFRVSFELRIELGSYEMITILQV